MDKTRMLLLNKTAKGFVLYTGLSNIRKHCRLQPKRKEKSAVMENKVLPVCFVWFITPKVPNNNFEVNIKRFPFKNKKPRQKHVYFGESLRKQWGGGLEMLGGQMLPLSGSNHFTQPHDYFLRLKRPNCVCTRVPIESLCMHPGAQSTFPVL